jgi:ABC-type nickel/cobalt efflux system permease component RcnA
VSLAATPALAHDIPNEQVDRAIQLTLHPGHLEVSYRVSLGELTLIGDLRRLVGQVAEPTHEALFDRYGRETAPLNARGLLVTVDGEPLDLGPAGFRWDVEAHPLYRFMYTAPLPDRGQLLLRDTNYASSLGTSRLAVRVQPGLDVLGYNGPADVDSVPERPVWMLSDDDERRTREVRLDFRPAVPGPSTITLSEPTLPPASAISPRSPSSRLPWLLDGATARSWPVLLLTAVVLGMAHAIQPGHGKSLVAAASLGASASWWTGVVLAVSATIAHTGVVLVVAALLWALRLDDYAAIHAALFGLAGFLIAGVGLWRLGRLLGRHDDHAPPATATIPEPGPHRSARDLVALGFAGGVVPCWDSVLLLVVALALGRVALGVGLVAAFSLGMGLVLLLVAATAQTLRHRFPHSSRWERVFGIASGLFLALIGVAMLVRA